MCISCSHELSAHLSLKVPASERTCSTSHLRKTKYTLFLRKKCQIMLSTNFVLYYAFVVIALPVDKGDGTSFEDKVTTASSQ